MPVGFWSNLTQFFKVSQLKHKDDSLTTLCILCLIISKINFNPDNSHHKTASSTSSLSLQYLEESKPIVPKRCQNEGSHQGADVVNVIPTLEMVCSRLPMSMGTTNTVSPGQVFSSNLILWFCIMKHFLVTVVNHKPVSWLSKGIQECNSHEIISNEEKKSMLGTHKTISSTLKHELLYASHIDKNLKMES